MWKAHFRREVATRQHPSTNDKRAFRAGALRPIFPLLVLLLLAAPSLAAAAPSTPFSSVGGPLLTGWPMFHGNPALTGTAGGPYPLRAQEVWSSSLPLRSPTGNDPPYAPSPVVSGGTVYLASDNVLYTLNSSTGQLVSASYLPGGSGSGPVVGTPLLLSSGVLAVAQDGGPDAMWFGALAGSAATTCNLGGNPASGSPTVVGSNVFQTDTAGNLWRIPLGTILGCPTTPWVAPGGGAQYFSTPSVGYVHGVPVLYVVDSGTRMLDAFQGVGSTAGTPLPGFPLTLAGNRLQGSLSLVNMTNASQVVPMGFVGDTSGGGGTNHLFALDLSTGRVAATLNLPPPAGGGNSGIVTTPALALSPQTSPTEQVYFGSLDGNLSRATFTTGASGGQLAWGWNFTGHGAFYASPVLWGGLVVDGDTSGWLYALNATNGALVWEADMGSAIYASPAISGDRLFESASSGQIACLSAASPPMTLGVPANVPGGTSAQVTVHVGNLNVSGVPQGNLSGVQVSLTSSAGLLPAPVLSTDATGTATFVWTAPLSTNTPVTVSFIATVAPVGYAPAQASGSTVVPPGSGSVGMPLTVSLSAAYSSLTPGASTSLNVTALLNTLPASGATVTLGVSPNLGSVTPSVVTAGSNGLASFLYVAPGNVPSVTSLLVTATATLGNHSGTANAPLTLLPTTNLSGLSVSFLSSSGPVSSKGTQTETVTVTLASSGTAEVNARVTFSVAAGAPGAFSSPTSYSNGSGIASATFTALSVGIPTSVLVTATAQISGLSSGTTSTLLTVDPWALNLSWVLPANGFAPGQGSPIGVTATSGGRAIGSGLAVSLSLGQGSVGTLNATTSRTDSQGIAWFTLIPSGGTPAVTLVASAGGGSGPYSATVAWASATLSTSAKGSTGASTLPLDLWLLIAALAAISILLLVLLLISRRPATGGKGRATSANERPAGWTQETVKDPGQGTPALETGAPEPKATPASPSEALPAETPKEPTETPPGPGDSPSAEEANQNWKE